MRTVKQLLDAKGNNVWSIGPDASVYDAIAYMSEKGVGALVVLETGELIGIISERDYARKVILAGRASKETSVRAIMSTEVIRASPSLGVEACLTLMTENRVRHLPVLDDGRLVGVLSIGDLVKSIIEEQRHLIEQLEQYISG